MTSPEFHESVVLETLDGYDFEKLCAKIFQKLNYGTVDIMPFSGDAGRDLLIHSPSGLIIVECKHQPHSNVGRPVVQKLHSATVSNRAFKGILITSGRFSQEAVDHANTLIPKIEMLDQKILTDLATRAGIELILEGESHTVLRFPLSQRKILKEKISSFIDRKCKSVPGKISDIVTIPKSDVRFIPSYLIEYDIDATFKTTIGVIHKEYFEGGKCLIDGNSGALLKQELANHLSLAPLAVYKESDFPGLVFSRSDFVIDGQSLTNMVKKIITVRHTKSIPYRGKNNQRYEKLCEPGDKDIFVTNIKQVYLPDQKLNVGIINQNYELNGFENAEKMLCYTQIFNCRICNSYIHSDGLVCNSCGGIVHGPRLLDSHGFVCKQCGKTICRNCTYDLGINNKVCKECADKSGKSLKRVSKKMNQRYIAGGGCLAAGLASSYVNFYICMILIVAGIGILASDYRSKSPPYEIM